MIRNLSVLLALSVLSAPAQIQISGSAISGSGVSSKYIGTDYASCDFETDFCQFQVNSDALSPDPVLSTDFAYSGTKSAKCQVVPNASAFLSEVVWLARNIAPYNHTGPKNPALTEPAGVCIRYRFLMPQASIDHIKAADRQAKLLRTRMNFDSPNGGWVSGTFGQNAGQGLPYDEWVSFNDTGDTTNGWTYQIGVSGKSGIVLTGSTWYTFIECMKQNGTTGHARGWLNGTLLYDTGEQTYLGRTTTNDEQSFEFGAHSVGGPDVMTQDFFVYIDDVLVTTSDISP